MSNAGSNYGGPLLLAFITTLNIVESLYLCNPSLASIPIIISKVPIFFLSLVSISINPSCKVVSITYLEIKEGTADPDDNIKVKIKFESGGQAPSI